MILLTVFVKQKKYIFVDIILSTFSNIIDFTNKIAYFDVVKEE